MAVAGSKARQTEATPSPYKVIRDPEFAKRLEQACDAYPHIPPKHSGRQSWIARELGKRFNVTVTTETVRKWFQGEAKPRPDKLVLIAQLLEVDMAWLSLGVDPDIEPRERKVRNASVDGAVNVVAGLIQMDGGHPAFPDKDDPVIDMHAIIRGAKYDIHVALGEVEGETLRFAVPTKHEDVVVLGVVRRGFSLDIYEIPLETIEAGHRRGGSIEIVVNKDGVGLRRVESFKTRL